jgi:hypothetical protein
VTTNYNAMGLPNRLRSSWYGDLVDGTTAGGGITNGVHYDEAGRLSYMRFPLGGNLWQSYGYYPWHTTDPYSRSSSDSNGRLRLVYVGTNPYWGDRYGSPYSYDSHGNVTVFEEWINNVGVTGATFTYDYQNRLTTGYGRNYGYDAAGRVTNYEGAGQTFHPYRPHAMAPNWTQYSVDLNGNYTTRVQNGVAQTLTWDHENRLRVSLAPASMIATSTMLTGNASEKSAMARPPTIPTNTTNSMAGQMWTNIITSMVAPSPSAAMAGLSICTRISLATWRWSPVAAHGSMTRASMPMVACGAASSASNGASPVSKRTSAAA